MLAERIHRPTVWWWRWYCGYALRKHFHRVVGYGQAVPGRREGAGTLVLCNHVSWWDGIVLDWLLRPRHRDLRCMVDAAQVARHPFFRRVGAFSVDRGSARDGVRACAHAAGLLRAGETVVMFPQGAIVPEERELVLERGFTWVLDEAPGANVRVMTLRYRFWEHQRPRVSLWVGEAMSARSAGLAEVTGAMRAGLAALAEAERERREGVVLLRGRRGIAEWRWGGRPPAEVGGG